MICSQLLLLITSRPLVSHFVLQSMKMAVRRLLCHLDDPNDRLAIMSTYCRHDMVGKHNKTVGCLMHPFGTPDLTLLASELSLLESSTNTDGMKPGYGIIFCEAVERYIAAQCPSSTPGRTHMVVLSPESSTYARMFLQVTPWIVHEFRGGLF